MPDEPQMSDREFWVEVRRAALILIRAVEKRYGLSSLLIDRK